jgi:2-iminobutanoate/2-iminopropanoate deaminase
MKASILLSMLLVVALCAAAQQQSGTAAASSAPSQDARTSSAAALGAGGMKPVTTKDAPSPAGPYSQAVKAGGFIFVSGQLPLDPATGNIVQPDDISFQTDRALRNLDAILDAASSSRERVVRTTVYLRDMHDFAAMNEIYSRYFKDTHPARSVVEVNQLPQGVLVEIDAVAVQWSVEH